MVNNERERERERQKYSLKDFEDEVKDLHPFFTNYFPSIFPGLIFLKDEWVIPKTKCFKSEGDRADTLAFFSDEKGKLRHLALIEYKWGEAKKNNNPVNQIKINWWVLENSNGYEVWKVYRKRLKKEEKEDDDFEVVGKDLRNRLWDKPILVCVANFGYFGEWHKKEAEKEKIILVEVQKYEDSEGNRCVLIWVVKGDGKRLGIDPNKAIIQIPKETPEEKKLILAQNIEDFLEELETGKWNDEIREINNLINDLFENTIEGKAKWENEKYSNKYFVYIEYTKKVKKELLIVKVSKKREKLKIYVRENELTANWSDVRDSEELPENIRRCLEIKKESYQNSFEKIKEYLELIKNEL